MKHFFNATVRLLLNQMSGAVVRFSLEPAGQQARRFVHGHVFLVEAVGAVGSSGVPERGAVVSGRVERIGDAKFYLKGMYDAS